MRPAKLVHHAVLRARAHPGGAQVMGRRIRRDAERAQRVDRGVHRLARGIGVLAHRHLVRVVVDVHVGHRLAELVAHIAVERDPVALLRQVLADQKHPGHVVVLLHDPGEVAPPGTRVQERGQEGRAERVQLQVVAADEAAPGVVARLVGDDARHRLAAVHPHRLVERGEHRPGDVPHVVPPHLAAGVRQPVREQRRGGVQQQPCGLDRVAGDAHDARLLALLVPLGVDVDDPGHRAEAVVLDPDRHRRRPQVKPAGLLGSGDLGGQRRPVRALLVALVVEPVLDGGRASVARDRVERHPARADARVADAPGAVAHHLEVVVGRRRRDAVRARDAQPVLGRLVVGLEVGQADRPVEQAGAADGPVLGADPELPFLEARAAAGPVNSRTADRLAGPRGQVRELLGYPP